MGVYQLCSCVRASSWETMDNLMVTNYVYYIAIGIVGTEAQLAMGRGWGGGGGGGGQILYVLGTM